MSCRARSALVTGGSRPGMREHPAIRHAMSAGDHAPLRCTLRGAATRPPKVTASARSRTIPAGRPFGWGAGRRVHAVRVREAKIGVPYQITTMEPSTQRRMTTASPASYDVRPMTAVVVALAVIGVVLLEHLGRG